MNEEKYIIELDHPYRKSETEPNSTVYVEGAILSANGWFITLALTYERERAVPLSNRRVIRRALNKITTIFINQKKTIRQPRPRAIRIA